MAKSCVVDSYLAALRNSLAKFPADDIDRIIDETADHLLSARTAALAAGLDAASVDTEILARFGTPTLVAKVFAEEAKRGSAVSTSLTRRAGMASMLSVILLVVGQTGNHATSRGIVHGVFLALLSFGFPLLALGLWGLRRRHGGLGTVGRAAFWWLVASPFLAAPALYAAPLVLAAEWLMIMTLLGVGLIRAQVLPAPALFLFTASPLFALLVVLGLSAASLDAGPWFMILLAPVAFSLFWLGWAMSREPALDVPHPSRTTRISTTN